MCSADQHPMHRYSAVDLPDTMPDRSRHSKTTADDAARDLASLPAGLKNSRLGRSTSGRYDSPRCTPLSQQACANR